MLKFKDFIKIITLLLLFTNITLTYADSINITHCEDCGKVLVGAVRIDSHSVRWQGTNTNGLYFYINAALEEEALGLSSRNFGITGSFRSDNTPDPTLMTYTSPQTNKWYFVSPAEVSILSSVSSNNFPSVGFYFSPLQAKTLKSGITYTGSCITTPCNTVNVSENVGVVGEGINDNVNTPALTLDVKVNGNTPEKSDILVNNNSSTSFTITPKLDTTRLPPEVSEPQYVEILIQAMENSQSCKSTSASSLFQDEQDTSNNFANDSYYHYLAPNKSKQCNRIYNYLVSIDKTFTFKAVNQANTGEDYVQYSFFIKGHYNPYSPVETDYPGSHHTFRLRTSNVAIPTTNKLTVDVTGNGTVTSNSGNINCPTNCSSDYNVNTPVTLTASPNTDAKFSGWGGNCSGNSTSTNITVDADKNCTATFLPSDVISTPDTFTLQVSIRDKDSNEVTGGTISVNNVGCTQSCLPSYAKDETVTLVATPTPNTDYIFSNWTGTAQCEGKTTTTLTIKMDSKQTCTALFVKKTVVAVEKACFTIDYVNDPDTKLINKVKLDAACSGNVTNYNWQIYPLGEGNPVTSKNSSFTTNKLADGNYTVTLIVGEDEAQDQVSQNFTIPPLLAKFEIKPDASKLTLDASTTSKAVDSGELTYRWWSSLGQTIKNGITAVIDYTTGILDVIGKYETITLTVIDEKGRVSSTSKKAKVNTAMPVEITSFDYSHLKTRTENGMTIVTLRAQAQDPDGGEISHEFTDSYGSSVQGTSVEEKDEKWLEVEFVYSVPIADTYYLKVTDNEGTTDEAILHIPMPTLGANAIDNKGNNTSTTSLFYGGISSDNGINYKKELSVKSSDTMAIRGYFKTDTNDVDKVADILLVIGYKNDSGQFFTDHQSQQNTTLDSPEEIAKLTGLANYTGIALKDEMRIDLPFTGTPQQFFPDFRGTIDFYLGYRLAADGKIVYSFPITLTVSP